MGDLEAYFNSVSLENRFKLDKGLDYDHDGVQRDLGTIATAMDQWEGNIAEQLQLTRPEIEAIRTKYPGELPLQTRATLQKWQEKFGPMATYRALITSFVRAGRRDCAEAVCKVLGSQPTIQRVPLNPIQRYATYLKGVYKSALVSSDKFPNLTCSEFINLALVKSDRISHPEADEFTKATLHGHIDEILQKKEPIKLEEVMKPVEGQQILKCVYMHGAPGVGKSTCVGELCKRWGTQGNDALNEYELVILLRLRENKVQEAQRLNDFCYHDNRGMREALVAEIEAREGEGVLFVLDGFDELPASLRKHSIFVRLISGTYLSHCTVLVTSRPSATADLLKVARPQIHKQIEVIGFTQKHIEQYARAFFASQPDVLSDFLVYISTHPAIRSLMYIPLNCAITTEIYSHNRTANRPIPQTMTQLYTEMSLTLLQRHLGEDDTLVDQLSDSLENLPPQLLEPFNSLAKLAFDGLERDEVIFHKLPSGFVHFGFMNSPTELYMGRKTAISHSFLHLTLQEFLAAFYISQLSPADQQSVFNKHYDWNVVWRFVAGLTGFHGIGWEVIKSKKGTAYDGERLAPFLTQCLYEAQEKADCDSVLGEAEVSFRGRGDFSAFDCYALGYCVANSRCMWRLNMHGNESLGGTLVEMFKHGLHSPNQSQPKMAHPNILYMKLKRCGLNLTAFNQLAELIPLMTNLEELDINVNPAGNGGLVKILQSLFCLKNFKALAMCDNNIGLPDIEALSSLIALSSCLKLLIIGDEEMPFKTVDMLLKTVLSPSSLDSVALNWNFQAVPLLEENKNLTFLAIGGLQESPNLTTFIEFIEVIPLMTNLKNFSICINPGNIVFVKLLHTLSHLKHLEGLELSPPNISRDEISALSCLVSPSSTLKLLVIDGRNMSPENTETMLKIVLSPSSLECVIFSSIDTEVDQAVKMLEENKNLTTLKLYSTSSKFSSLIALALCKNCCLKDLYISSYYVYRPNDCINISDSASSLAELLRTNQTLETMLWHCKFTNLKEDLVMINSALQSNCTLKTLNIQTSLQGFDQEMDQESLDPRLTITSR